jgi:serine/threonine protein kinase
VIGTRKYIAPEVLRGEAATVRSDLYSCAMVLQEAFGDRLTPGLASLVEELGDEDPARRPESASPALERLAAASAPSALGASATAPTAPLPPDRTAPTIPIGATTARTPSHPRLLAGLAALGALLVIGILMLSDGDEGSSPGGEQSSEGPDAASTMTQNVPMETAKTLESAEPSVKHEKVKPPKPEKSPPGKAKGLRKH